MSKAGLDGLFCHDQACRDSIRRVHTVLRSIALGSHRVVKKRHEHVATISDRKTQRKLLWSTGTLGGEASECIAGARQRVRERNCYIRPVRLRLSERCLWYLLTRATPGGSRRSPRRRQAEVTASAGTGDLEASPNPKVRERNELEGRKRDLALRDMSGESGRTDVGLRWAVTSFASLLLGCLAPKLMLRQRVRLAIQTSLITAKYLNRTVKCGQRSYGRV